MCNRVYNKFNLKTLIILSIIFLTVSCGSIQWTVKEYSALADKTFYVDAVTLKLSSDGLIKAFEKTGNEGFFYICSAIPFSTIKSELESQFGITLNIDEVMGNNSSIYKGFFGSKTDFPGIVESDFIWRSNRSVAFLEPEKAKLKPGETPLKNSLEITIDLMEHSYGIKCYYWIELKMMDKNNEIKLLLNKFVLISTLYNSTYSLSDLFNFISGFSIKSMHGI